MGEHSAAARAGQAFRAKPTVSSGVVINSATYRRSAPGGPELFDYRRDPLIDVIDQDQTRVHVPPPRLRDIEPLDPLLVGDPTDPRPATDA